MFFVCLLGSRGAEEISRDSRLHQQVTVTTRSEMHSGRICKSGRCWWYSMVLDGTRWYSMVLGGTWWYSMVLDGTRWYSVVLGGTRWYSVVLGGTRWYSVVLDILKKYWATTGACPQCFKSQKVTFPKIRKLHRARSHQHP